MENLGKYLLELRLKRGIEYAQIVADIHYTEAQIRALEQNQLFDLGHYGFVKALVYNYSRYLEADLNLVMREFAIMMPDNTKKEFTPRRVVKEKKIMLSTNFLWTIGIVIFAGTLGSILFYSYSQGWLKAPDFFEKDEPSPKQESVEVAETPRPDSLRLRMRILSESIPKSNVLTDIHTGAKASHDTTDYIGNLLGKSPVNVQIN
ncbi:MAG: helix-turn-helix domain-containing protein [Candidatus Cloacimonetes bacterium]|nr:helix-turn-helix domain-containing protein [Candidatus Cloacimonadota bacterium]HQB98610.1 helix-turn-helix domain-containing protein [Candidatus Cloacimonadota bacterium]